MKVEIFQGEIEELSDVLDSWKENCDNRFGFELDKIKFQGDIQGMIDAEQSDLLVLRSKLGRILGFMGVVLISCPLDHSFIANEHYWYVLPEHRTQSIKLLAAAQAWAKDKGCQRLMVNASRLAGKEHDKVCRLYERMGYVHFETTYIKEL